MAEIKVTKARIEKGTREAFCALIVGQPETEGNTKITKTLTANFQSVADLIEYHAVLKAALTRANAATYVEIGGKRLSLAEAIELKHHSLAFTEELLNEVASQRLRTEMQALGLNQNVHDNASKAFGANADRPGDLAMMEKYIRDFGRTAHVPQSVERQIAKLKLFVEEFRRDADAEINRANALTTVTI